MMVRCMQLIPSGEQGVNKQQIAVGVQVWPIIQVWPIAYTYWTVNLIRQLSDVRYTGEGYAYI